jgi:hypothetical protein
MVAVAEAMNSIDDSRVSQIGLSTAATLALPVAGKGASNRNAGQAGCESEEGGARGDAGGESEERGGCALLLCGGDTRARRRPT